jgi:hypothetical protein
MLPPLIDRFVTNCAKTFSMIAWGLMLYAINYDTVPASWGGRSFEVVRFGPLSVVTLATAFLSLVCSLPTWQEAFEGYGRSWLLALWCGLPFFIMLGLLNPTGHYR